MIRASIVPYLGGRTGLAVADETGRLLYTCALDAGELRPNPNAALERDHAFLRVIEPHHLAALAAEVTRRLAGHGVTTLLVEAPSGTGAAAGWSRQIGNAVTDEARAMGLTVEYRSRVVPAAGTEPTALRHAVALLRDQASPRKVAPLPGCRGAGADEASPPVARDGGHVGHTPFIEAPSASGEPRIIAFDLGSASLGIAVLADALPINVLHAVTLGVDPDDLDLVVTVAVEFAVRVGAARAAIEHGVKFHAPYFTIPPGSTPSQVNAILARHRAQTTSIAAQHAICGKLQDKLSVALASAGIEAVTWARETWAHRVRQHHQGSITTAQANESLRDRCAPGAWERLRDQHQRDAAGVGCMWLVDPPAPPKRYRPPKVRTAADIPERPKLTPEARAALYRKSDRERKRRVRGDASEQERFAAGCMCLGKHLLGCPVGDRLREARMGAKISAAVSRGPYLR